MKDAIGFAIFLLAISASMLMDDYRAERCVDHGGKWVHVPGCGLDYCDRSKP